MVQGLLLLRDYYKAEYKKALQDKVVQQRRSQQQRQVKHEEETKASEEHQVCKIHVHPCTANLRLMYKLLKNKHDCL